MAGDKKKYKQFPIDTIENGMVVLGSLIVNVVANSDKYKEYYEEAKSLLNEYGKRIDGDTKHEILIPAAEYDNINDKLLYRQREILKYLADHQDSSFSYIDVRKKFRKRGYLNTELTTELNEMLNELLDVRNWTFHNAQSMLVATMENAQRKAPDWLKSMVTIQPQVNPVVIPRITHYDILVLISLVKHAENRIKQFDTILNAMKNDYSEMYKALPNQPYLFFGRELQREVIYADRQIVSRLIDESSEATQLSMGIQKSKYDGTEESFKKWTLGEMKATLHDNVDKS